MPLYQRVLTIFAVRHDYEEVAMAPPQVPLYIVVFDDRTVWGALIPHIGETRLRVRVEFAGDSFTGVAPEDYPAALTRLTQGRAVHAVIIAGDHPDGLRIARSLPPEYRARTMVVWNDYARSQSRLYAGLGIARFGNRLSVGTDGRPDITVFLAETARLAESSAGAAS